MIPDWLTPQLQLRLSALGFAQIINWGVLYYTLALIGPHIVAETGWSDAFVYSGFAVATLVTGLFSPLSGSRIDRFGGLPVMLIGTVMGAIGMLVLSTAKDGVIYMVAWAIIGASMSACLYDSAFASIAQFAGETTRKSISLITLIAGFASTAIWPATSALLQFMDWRDICAIDAGLILFFSAPLIFIALKGAHKKSDKVKHNDDDRTATPQALMAPLIPRERFTSAMVLFSIVLAALGFVANALSVHVITLFQTLHIDLTSAILAGSLIGPAQVGARVIELAYGRRLSAVGLGMIPVILMPLAFVIPLVMTAGPVVAVGFGLVYGAANGLATIARGVVPYALFGSDGYGRRLGLVAAPALMVKAAAPAVFGAILASFGPSPAILFILGISLLATFAMAALFRLSKQSV